jgi:hypothetical protein
MTRKTSNKETNGFLQYNYTIKLQKIPKSLLLFLETLRFLSTNKTSKSRNETLLDNMVQTLVWDKERKQEREEIKRERQITK